MYISSVSLSQTAIFLTDASSLSPKPEQQRFTNRNGVLTSTGTKRRGAVSGRPLPERMDFGPAVAARQTHQIWSQICLSDLR